MVIVVLNKHGTKIGKSYELFKFGIPGKSYYTEELIPAEQIEEIIVECNSSLTSGAINLAAKYAIPILFVKGKDIVSCIHPLTGHGTVRIRREQILAYHDERGVMFSTSIIEAASNNKVRLLKQMKRTRDLEENIEREIEGEIEGIERIIKELRKSVELIEQHRNYLFAKEAEITKKYYICIGKLLKPTILFEGRTRRPPKDAVNAMLSYGYTILTAQMLKATIIAGLEPHAGFLHTDRAGKVSFVLDIIEIFRQPVVDRLVFNLLSKKKIKEEDFNKSEKDCLMKEDTKKKYLDELFQRFREKNVEYNGKITSFRRVFIEEARKAGKFFMQKGKYQPFVYRY